MGSYIVETEIAELFLFFNDTLLDHQLIILLAN